MKIYKLVLIVAVTLLGIAACQNEIIFNTNGPSAGTLKSDATGDCLPSTINGIYKKDSTLTSENFIDVSVNVTTLGTFTIKSDTVNGFSFIRTGSFGVLGNNVVRLYGSGKPLSGGLSSFTVEYNSSSCVIDITVLGTSTGAAIYTLGGAGGPCAGFTLGTGTYAAGQILVAANTVTTNVSVTGPGTYELGTDTVNGIYFRAVGVFTTATVQSITLIGHGTPIASGSYIYKLTNGSTTCTFSITVGGGGTGVFTLGTGGNCVNIIPAGTYKQGVAMTAANTVKIDVTVTTPGTYNIIVLAVNDVSFSAAGTFAGTGNQQITLNASSIPSGPTNAGPFSYIVSSPGAGSCTFSITYAIATTPPVTNLDYIPRTNLSNWSTKLVGGAPGDTTYMEVNPNPITLGGNTYKIFEIKETGTPVDSLYFRENAGRYYQYFNEDFGGLLDAPYIKDIKVLDSTLSVLGTWDETFGANSSGGIPINSAKVKATILEKGYSANVEGNNYIKIIRVEYIYSVDIGLGFMEVAKEERWYAKGFGVIKSVFQVEYPTTQPAETTNTTRIQIN